MPPGVIGSDPRSRTNVHPANASVKVTSSAPTPSVRRQTTRTANTATIFRVVFDPPANVSSASATAGATSMKSWFHRPVSVTASVTAAGVNPQPRSIANASPMPTAAPPGATYVDAVDACAITDARQ